MKFAMVLVTLLFGFQASASIPESQCFAQPEGDEVVYGNILPQIDFQVVFDGSRFVAKSLSINVSRGAVELPAAMYARIVNHYLYGQDQASEWTKLEPSQPGRLTGQIEMSLDLGGRVQPALQIWQTVQFAYGSVEGPIETRNFNLSKAFLSSQCN